MDVSNIPLTLIFSNLSVGDQEKQILSDETARLVTIALSLVVSPVIGIIGVVFNVFSIIVLFKHGVHKCSNILLISLAFLDTLFLIGYNSIPHLLYTMQGDGRFLYSEHVSLLLYVLYFVMIVMDYAGGLAGLTLPMFITVERLVAVFIPLRFGQIVTPFRTWMAVAGTVLFWLTTITYNCFWYRFEYVFDEKINRSVGLIQKSTLFYKDFNWIPIYEEVLFSIKFPPLFTVCGCIAIVIKVKMTSIKRRKMTSSSKAESTSKTTKTLLIICSIYLLVCMILATPGYLPSHMSAYSLTTDNPSNMANIIYQIASICVCCNSSWNFLVYVGMNKNFRDTFKTIITQRSCKGRSLK